jgi:hypothetical protein
MGIDVISEGAPVLKNNRLKGRDMSPRGLFFDQSGIKDITAEIVQGSDEIPFFMGRWGPEVVRRVMLDQFPNVMGQNLPIMDGFFLFFRQVKVVLFGPIDNGGKGNLLFIFFGQ